MLTHQLIHPQYDFGELLKIGLHFGKNKAEKLLQESPMWLYAFSKYFSPIEFLLYQLALLCSN
jgi:hypothetical protein